MNNLSFYLLKRREFIKTLGVAAAGLVVPFNRNEILASTVDFSPNLFIFIPTRGKIKLVCHRSEMGQGIRTSLVQMIADELEAPLDQIEIIQALGHEKYGDQNTDGSMSIRFNWQRLRTMGATARAILHHTAARRWGVGIGSCLAENGHVLHKPSKRKISYQDLSAEASKFDKDIKVTLKEPHEFKYIGKGIHSFDGDNFSRGKAIFGMDVNIPNLVYVALLRCPVPAGKLKNYQIKDLKKVPGVIDSFHFPSTGVPNNVSSSVGVVATNTWAAFEGCKKIQIAWDIPKLPIPNSSEINSEFKKASEDISSRRVYREEGVENTSAAIHTKTFEYFAPLLCHSPMEPLVAVALVKSSSCEIWAPTQSPQRVREAVANYLGFTKDQVKINVTFLGGGFGRKSRVDFVLEAVIASKQLNKPVKLVWTREDEIRHGFYHPASYQKISVGFNKQNQVISWKHHSVFTSLSSAFKKDVSELESWEMELGATPLPFQFPYIQICGTHVQIPVKVGWLRSVQNIFHSFSINSTMDEIARNFEMDPIDFALKNIGKGREFHYTKSKSQNTQRLIEVIHKVKETSSWISKQKEGGVLGFAHHYSFESYLAAVVELKLDNISKKMTIKNVYIVIDCGMYVNPDSIKAQLEGSVFFGLSIVNQGQISYKNGHVVESNFDNYPIARMSHTPNIEVSIMKNSYSPAGVGEPGVPVFVSAYANAVSRSTGKRIFSLPLKA